MAGKMLKDLWTSIMLRTTWQLIVRMVLQFDSGFIDGFYNGSPLESISYDLILVIVGLYDEPVQISIDVPGLAEVFIPLDSLSATKTQSSSASSGSSGTTFEPDRGYHLYVFHEKEHQFRRLHVERTFSAGLWHSKSLSDEPRRLRAWI